MKLQFEGARITNSQPGISCQVPEAILCDVIAAKVSAMDSAIAKTVIKRGHHIKMKAEAHSGTHWVAQPWKRYGISRITWWSWIASGNAPKGVWLGPRILRWRIEALDAWEKKREEEGIGT